MIRAFRRGLALRSAVLVVGLLGFAQAGQNRPPQEGGIDLEALEFRLERFKREEHSLRRSLERGRTEAELLERRVVARGRAYYRASRALPGNNFFEHAVRMERLRQGLLNDLARVERLSVDKKNSDRRLMLLKERRAPLDLEHSAAGRARDALLSQRERERAFQMAFSSSKAHLDHTAIYSAGAKAANFGTKFGAMLGLLPFPLLGRAEVEKVRLPHANGPGLILRASIGTPARAVFAGRVAYADEYAQYGRTVILDHGNDYFTVTAGLEKIDVRVGDDLPQNTRLGLAGTRGSTGQIYFEIRRKDENLSPSEWLGI